MMTLYSLMGERRKFRIEEIILSWINNGRKVHMSNYCKDGHYLGGSNRNPDGSCKIYKLKYNREYYRRKRGISRIN